MMSDYITFVPEMGLKWIVAIRYEKLPLNRFIILSKIMKYR